MALSPALQRVGILPSCLAAKNLLRKKCDGYMFDYQDRGIFGCVADISWITGHTYVVYGPLCNGDTTVLFESTLSILTLVRKNWEMCSGKQHLWSPVHLTSLPGMAQTIYNDHKRFLETHMAPYPGFFFTGDGLYHTSEGYYQLTGQLDDIINISAHWLGTAEVEDVVIHHVTVAESAVISYPHETKREGAYMFVVLKDSGYMQETLAAELWELISQKIAKYAASKYVQVMHWLPKTCSGKIMQQVLRKIVEGKASELRDLTTLDDHEAVQQITEEHKCLVERQKRC